MNDAFHYALRDTEFFRNSFVVNVFDVLTGDGLPVLLVVAFFSEQSFYMFLENIIIFLNL